MTRYCRFFVFIALALELARAEVPDVLCPGHLHEAVVAVERIAHARVGASERKLFIFWSHKLFLKALTHLEAEGFGPILSPEAMVKASPECKADIELALKEGLGLDTSADDFVADFARFFKDSPTAFRFVDDHTIALPPPPKPVGSVSLASRESVVRALRALVESGATVTPTALNSSFVGGPDVAAKARAMTETITRAAGNYATPADVYASAVHHFGSLDRALRIAGLKEKAVSALIDRVSPLEQKIIKSLRVLKAHESELEPLGFSFKYSPLRYPTPPLRAAIKKLLRANGIDLEPEQIYSQLPQTRFKTVEPILKAAGLEPEARLGVQRFVWTKETVLEAIRILRDHGVPLGDAFMAGNTSYPLMDILGAHFSRRELTGSNLRNAAIKFLGSWEAAVGEAGLNYVEVSKDTNGKFKNIKKATDWNESRILSALQILHEHGIGIDATSLKNDYSAETARLLSALLGRRTTPQGLRLQVFLHYGAWEFLPRIPSFSGNVPDITRPLSFEPMPPPSVSDASLLNFLAEKKFELTAIGLRSRKQEVEAALKARFDDDFDVDDVIKHIASRHGTLNDALEEAGLPTYANAEDPSDADIREWTIYLSKTFHINPTNGELGPQSREIRNILAIAFKRNFSGWQLLRRLVKDFGRLYYASKSYGLPLDVHGQVPSPQKKKRPEKPDRATGPRTARQYGADDEARTEVIDEAPRPDAATVVSDATARLDRAIMSLSPTERQNYELLKKYLLEHDDFSNRRALESYFTQAGRPAPTSGEIDALFAKLRKLLE